MSAIDGPVTTMSNATFRSFAHWDAPTSALRGGATLAEFTVGKSCGRDCAGDRLGNYSAMTRWQRKGCRRPSQSQSRRLRFRLNTYAMIRRRAAAAGIATKMGNHTFRATGITAYLKNGGTLEKAAAMANHASTRTTQLYDRRRDEMSLDEVERITI
jgi:integrase